MSEHVSGDGNLALYYPTWKSYRIHFTNHFNLDLGEKPILRVSHDAFAKTLAKNVCTMMTRGIPVTLFKNGGQLVANLCYSAALLERTDQNYPNKLSSFLTYICSYQSYQECSTPSPGGMLPRIGVQQLGNRECRHAKPCTHARMAGTTVCMYSVVYQLRKIYGLKRPRYRLLMNSSGCAIAQ